MAERVETLSIAEARRLAFATQFSWARRDGVASEPGERAAAALVRLGHVQIDTISVVERAHHHVFWSRDRDYAPSILPGLEAPPRRAFEYWAHAAAYLPIEDYRYCLPRMRRVAETGHEWFPTDPAVVEAVYDRIRDGGALKSSDFEGGGPRGPWWDWKPAKAALEYLFMSGRLLVVSRPGFQKLYDLAERVLPPGLDATYPTEAEMGDWYVRRAALALGVFSEADVAYMRKDGLSSIRAALGRATDAGTLRAVKLEGDERRKYWASTEALDLPSGDEPEERPLRILSPFDNLIIDRKRARRVFGLEYSLECYLPVAKRSFGYFALPVFWRCEPAGLVDCKADRANGLLIVNNSSFRFGDEAFGLADSPMAETRGLAPSGFAEALNDELHAYARFNGCEAVSLGGAAPDRPARPLNVRARS